MCVFPDIASGFDGFLEQLSVDDEDTRIYPSCSLGRCESGKRNFYLL